MLIWKITKKCKDEKVPRQTVCVLSSRPRIRCKGPGKSMESKKEYRSNNIFYSEYPKFIFMSTFYYLMRFRAQISLWRLSNRMPSTRMPSTLCLNRAIYIFFLFIFFIVWKIIHIKRTYFPPKFTLYILENWYSFLKFTL